MTVIQALRCDIRLRIYCIEISKQRFVRNDAGVYKVA